MADTDFTDGVTLTSAAWFDDVNSGAYNTLYSVTGTNTVVATGPSTYSSYTSSGPLFKLIPAFTNTGAATLNVTPFGGSALGAKNIFANGAALSGGELRAGVPVQVIYDGTQFNIAGGGLVGNPAAQTFLSTDIALSSTSNYFNVVDTGSIGGAGQTWLIVATAVVVDATTTAQTLVRIWDTSTVFAESACVTPGATFPSVVTVQAIVSPSAATTYHLSAKNASTTNGLVNTTGLAGTANKATSITAIRLK